MIFHLGLFSGNIRMYPFLLDEKRISYLEGGIADD
jgi:hypothetical protein